MKNSDCLVLEIDGVADVVDFARAALRGHVEIASLTERELAECDVQPGAEMGTLIVPFSADTDLEPVRAAVARCRAQRGKIAVLGLADTCAQAGQMPMGDLFDTLVSIEWLAAPEIIRRFVDSHRTYVQNRAFKAFLDSSVDGYWIWYVDRDVIEWSRRTADMTRQRLEDAPDTMARFAEMVHPHDRDRVEQAIRNHLDNGAPYKNIELRLRMGDGRYGHFVANGQALRDEEGKAIILVGSLTDRSLMQKVERQLEDTQKRFTVLFHHMNDAAVLADVVTGRILEANQPAERLWGKSIAELVGSHQSELHPPNLSDEMKKAFTDHIAALMQNKRDTIHVPIMRADGTEVPAEISSSLIEIDGRLMIVGVFRDISERERAAREIRERDAQIQLSSHLAAMGTLAAGVAHEINNPLTYVLGNLELLRQALHSRGEVTPDIAQALDAAATGGEYVREIVADLKSISRIDGAENDCDPAEVIRIASRMAMSDLRHRAQLDMALGKVARAGIASVRLSQVILNLLSNATRAFASSDPAQNRIAISVDQVGDRVRIVIEDNGVGIAPDDLKKVCEPFFTRQSQTGGTGLGLSICRRILSDVDGRLSIDSELGKGTRVTICLPVSDGAGGTDVADAAIRPAPVRATPPRVVVVDDDVLVTTLVARMLADGFDVTVFNDPREALEALQGGLPCDVILCDIMMPYMDGQGFHSALGDGPPFLFLSGGAVTAQSIAFERRMASEGRLMHKPFDTADLRRKLHHIVQTHANDTATIANGGNGRMTQNSNTGTGQPAPDILSELEELLGRDALRDQFRKLAEQMRGLAARGPDLPADVLAQEAHKVAGAADVMGLRAIGGHLRGCQQAAAEGDLDRARAAIVQVRPMQKAFESFVAEY